MCRYGEGYGVYSWVCSKSVPAKRCKLDSLISNSTVNAAYSIKIKNAAHTSLLVAMLSLFSSSMILLLSCLNAVIERKKKRRTKSTKDGACTGGSFTYRFVTKIH